MVIYGNVVLPRENIEKDLKIKHRTHTVFIQFVELSRKTLLFNLVLKILVV